MSGSKTTQQQSQTNNTLDPWVKSLIQTNYDQAEQVANTPFTPYTGTRFADFTPDQTQAQSMFTGIANNATGQDSLDAAIAAAKNAGSFVPATVSPTSAPVSTYTPSTYNATLLDPASIQQFEDPYQSQVIDATSADANHALQVQENANNAAATRAGGWRGSALAVQNGVAEGDSNRALDTTIANLRSQGFNTAAGLAGANVDRENAAGQFNTGATNAADQFNAGAANTSSLATAAQSLAAQEANQNAGLTANAQQQSDASLLGNLSGQDLGEAQTRAGLISAVGDTQQAHNQQALDFNWQEFLRQLAYPAQQQQIRNTAIGLVPALTDSSTSGTTTQTSSPGLSGIISSLADIGKAGAAIFAPSDRRLKADIKTIGHDDKGRRWVDFRYKAEPKGTHHIGLIAQETLKTDPHAVVRDPRSGFLGIDYSKMAA